MPVLVDAHVDPRCTHQVTPKCKQEIPPHRAFSTDPEEESHREKGNGPEIEGRETEWENETGRESSQVKPPPGDIQCAFNDPRVPAARGGPGDYPHSAHETRTRRL